MSGCAVALARTPTIAERQKPRFIRQVEEPIPSSRVATKGGFSAMSSALPADSLYAEPWAKRLVYRVAVAVVVAAVGTIIATVLAYVNGKRDWIIVFAFFWTVVPPAWFWVDYFVVFRRGGNLGQFEAFKHGQQVSAAIWAAIAVSLAALAGSDALEARVKEHAPKRQGSDSTATAPTVSPPGDTVR
jgi:hypothetical protein